MSCDRHILVVEDDADILESLGEVLADEGYRVSTAANGRDALALLERADELPQLIVLDLMMPVMSGWELRRELEKSETLGAIPVVLLSGDVHGIESACSLLGAVEGLVKPVNLETLLAVVERHCRADAPPLSE